MCSKRSSKMSSKRWWFCSDLRSQSQRWFWAQNHHDFGMISERNLVMRSWCQESGGLGICCCKGHGVVIMLLSSFCSEMSSKKSSKMMPDLEIWALGAKSQDFGWFVSGEIFLKMSKIEIFDHFLENLSHWDDRACCWQIWALCKAQNLLEFNKKTMVAKLWCHRTLPNKRA